MIIYINAYKTGRAYGGPEEGGWWYYWGMPLASVPMEVEAIEKAHDVPEVIITKCKLTRMFEGACVCIEKEFATPYPKEIPHYE